MTWTYEEAVKALDTHINLEKTMAVSRTATPSLDRITELMHLLGDPQTTFPSIHLTGTNGKTSTARFITRLLEVKGLTVGTYTSPDLERINERISRNGEPISNTSFAELVEGVLGIEALMQERASRFDVLTAMAFLWFSDLPVHAAVVEVGLLGRWDSTNVIDAHVAVVTNVGTDHLDMAGSVEAIAYEKAGIVKPDSILVLGETDPNIVPVFRAEQSAAVWQRDIDFACVDNLPAHGGRLLDLRTPGASYDGVYLPVHGRHQGDNAACALAAAEAFFGEPLSDDDVNEAFAGASSPGRMEVAGRHPLVVLDGAHNTEGAAVAGRALAEEFGDRRHRIVVFGTLRPHDPTKLLTVLDPGPIRLVVACEPPSPRALPASEVVAAAQAMGLESVARPDVADAVAFAMDQAGDDDLVFVTGSLTTVGAARAALRRHRS